MKVSVNWLKQFTNVNLPIDELVDKIGSQLGAVEAVVRLTPKYQGVVVVKVVSCEKHPSADKLRVCRIDDGRAVKNVQRDEDGLVQVVCGAPNVRPDMLAAWLPPGSTLPSTFDADPFVLEARDLRGSVSNGMLASAHELDLSDDRSGIVEVDIAAEPGTAFSDVYQLDDYIIDIENKMFTHRPDCFGMLGIAREVAGIQQLGFESPEWYVKDVKELKPAATALPLVVRNEIPDLVPRFMMVALAGTEVKPSSLIIQTYLSRIGIRPVNSIVDATNYIMALTGQPLHVFDYDKVKAQDPHADKVTIVVRKPEGNEELTLLNGKTVKPHSQAILIATATKPIGLGGIIGGAETEVDSATKNIILECANFDLYSIRRTSMVHGLFTDAVTRFTKAQSPLQNPMVLNEAVNMLQAVSGSQVASEVIDIAKTVEKPQPLTVAAEFVNERLGLDLSAEDMAGLLANVEFDVQLGESELVITPPFWRTDIHIPEDIVEEVGRLHGFDKLPLTLPKRTIQPAKRNPELELCSRLRARLSRAGANEALTYSFVHGDLLKKARQNESQAFKIANAISPDLQYYRLSLTPSLLEKIRPNIKAGYGEFAIFEIGKTHQKEYVDKEGLPAESRALALVFSADNKASARYEGAAFYQARTYLMEVLKEMGVNVSFVAVQEHNPENKTLPEWLKPFDSERSALVLKQNETIGVVGEYRPEVRRALKLPAFTAGFEIGLHGLDGQPSQIPYRPLPRFPKVQQDITLRVPSDVAYQAVAQRVESYLREHAKSRNLFAEMVPHDIYQADTVTDERNITFRVQVASYERTLTAEEVNSFLDKMAEVLSSQLGISRV